MAISKTEQIINDSQKEIIDLIIQTFAAVKDGNFKYKTAWSNFEEVVQDCIVKYFKLKFPKGKFIIPDGKNTYPDIGLQTDDGNFAIDIKTSEGSKNPEFDMARLDTMVEKRIDVFLEEWEIVIKYDKKTGSILKVYFNLFREIVGKHKFSGGIKYRPYDGKVRPKTWDDMEKNVVYWDSKEKYLKGIEMSTKYRWKANISTHLAPILSEEEKEEFKKLFDNPVDIPEESDEDENGDANPDLFSQK